MIVYLSAFYSYCPPIPIRERVGFIIKSTQVRQSAINRVPHFTLLLRARKNTPLVAQHTQIAKSSPSISFRHNNCVTTECSHISKAILLYAYLFSHNLLLLCCRAVRSGNVPKRKTNKDTQTDEDFARTR